jgi:uncharacterized sulfatase
MMRNALMALLLLASARPLDSARPTTQGDRMRRPNIIVVLIDDARYADYSSYGNKRVETVNIDRMAAEGLRFAQYYVNSPICSPSRSKFEVEGWWAE